MAYVKQTQEIWGRVVRKINEMFERSAKHASSLESHGMTEPQLNDKLFALTFQPGELDLINQLKDRFFPHTYDKINYLIQGEPKSWYYTAQLKQGMRLPDWFNSMNNRIVIKDPEIVDVFTRRQNEMDRVQKEKNDFIAKVETAWESAPSVNSLIKAWPSFIDLIPPDVLERVNKKVERVKPEDIDIDTAALSVHLLKAKVIA